ncbi:hypothetical protein SJA_C2-04930 [Sphingobium indicum UT26S]|uniref:Uncharacterized protein n=1 Tax=Sphingobium indicum (strain DSM 16413 / CCM 7287 / MTCC 6362 / UT26 / NBRC 101211 / UT26S) TaxID=452662 RepID=D4Z6Z8_SPHIU|nr:hypothetical protein SJA_C2-04930 [Sphingobium indicum UT26S]
MLAEERGRGPRDFIPVVRLSPQGSRARTIRRGRAMADVLVRANRSSDTLLQDGMAASFDQARPAPRYGLILQPCG